MNNGVFQFNLNIDWKLINLISENVFCQSYSVKD